MDCIEVSGIRSYGYTGFLPEERILGQWFEVDLNLWVDLQTSGKSDDLKDTVDYRNIIIMVKHIIKTAKFALVEKLADVIAEDILKIAPIDKVRVRLSKPAAPIPDFGGRITIDITRSR
jgi:7,8-dihydroneopterin aldolase/epimerase/oxygenase